MKDTLSIEFIGTEKHLISYGFHYDSIYDRYIISFDKRINDIVVKKNANKKWVVSMIHPNVKTLQLLCEMYAKKLISFIPKEKLFHGK